MYWPMHQITMIGTKFAYVMLFQKTLTLAAYDDFVLCNIKNEPCFTSAKSEYERWDCYGKYIFRKADNPAQESYIEHECTGTGWGGSIRSLYNGFGLATILDRRLIVYNNVMHQLWSPPYGLEAWDFGLGKKLVHGIDTHFNFEKYGFNNDPNQEQKFDVWIRNLSIPLFHGRYENSQILNTGICAGFPRMLLSGSCTSELLTNFAQCAAVSFKDPSEDKRVTKDHYLIPFFSMVFSNPSPLMVSTLSTIRRRVNLPELPAGYEPKPGIYGLHTPGYYIYALHIRRVPLGFEPHSTFFNDEKKMLIVRSFWKLAMDYAKQAKAIAECRGEKLLIYFATDDAWSLRPIATQAFSSYGRVIFGLAEDEVGHSNPQWTDEALQSVRKTALALENKGITAADLIGEPPKPSSKSKREKLRRSTEMSVSKVSNITLEEMAVRFDTSAEATVKHAHMALVEWWILASSNWLVTHVGSSFGDTAAGWGLGPHGHMERMDEIHGEKSHHFHSVFRKDWNTEGCPRMFAANSEHNERCPNKKKFDPQTAKAEL